MSTPQIIPGQQFGKWTVLRETEALYGGRLRPLWDCQCVCGTVRGIASDALVGGKSKQCRTCGNREKALLKSRLVHGQSDTRLHSIWMQMRRRCERPSCPDFHRYGGRGISVCAEWGDFASFYDWALSNGYESGLTLDRVDNEKGYSPDNCRWATRTTQNRNRRDNIRYDWKGALLTLAEIAEAEGIAPADALDAFMAMVRKADVIVGHNISFDIRMIRILAARVTGMKWDNVLPTFCTMRRTTNMVRVLGPKARHPQDWKWPTLIEATRHFFGEDHEGAHRARPDCDASARIFFHLKEQGSI